MGTTSDKLTYLNETKALLKNKINLTGANITTDTFRSYPTKLQNALLDVWNNEGEPIFTNWGTKVNGEGTNVKLDNTINARMKLTPKGNTSQTGTPTPTSPIPVNVVSGDNYIDICGKNLCPDNFTNGVFNNNIGLIQSHDNNHISYENYIKVLPSTQYYIKHNHSFSGTGSTSIFEYDKNKNFIQRLGFVGTNSTAFTTNSETRYINISVYDNNGASIDGFECQLEKGNQATTYETYIGHSYPLYLGVENLKDYTTDFTKQAGWSTEFAVSMGQIININIAQASSLVWGVLGYDTSAYNGKQMTLSFDIKTSGDNINVYFDTTSTFAYTTNNANSVPISSEYKRVSFTTNSANNCLYTMIKNTTTNTSATIQIKNVMLSIGGKTSYFPYGTTPIELCKIGNYQDYIYKDSGKWYLHKEIGKVVLDGSESWGYAGATSIFYTTSIIDYATSDNVPFSNYYIGVNNVAGSGGMVSQNNNTISFINISGGTTPRFYIKDTRYTDTINDLKTWLSSNNMVVYYALATPTNTEIKNTTLITQLEALKGAMSYEGQTNIDGGFMIVGASALGELS